MTHKHVCACGDYYVCSRNPDQCPRDWTCPACEDDQRDDYFRQPKLSKEADRANHREG